jgi:ribokinase
MAGRIPKVIVAGPCYADMAVKCEIFPRAGEIVEGSGFSCHAGGLGTNRAIAARLCDCQCHLISKVGDDLLGRMILSNLVDNHVGTEFVYVAQAMSTGVVMTMVNADGENIGCCSSGANRALSNEEIGCAGVEQLFSDADVCLVHAGLGVDVVTRIIRVAEMYKTKIILEADFSIVQADQIGDMGWPMEYFTVNMLIPRFQQQSVVTGLDIAAGVTHKIKHICSELVAMGIECVVVKMGARGCFVIDRDGGKQIAGFEGECIANHCSCDDAFAGAIAASIGAGDGLETAVKFAQAASVIAADRIGEEKMPSKEEIIQLLINNSD